MGSSAGDLDGPRGLVDADGRAPAGAQATHELGSGPAVGHQQAPSSPAGLGQ